MIHNFIRLAVVSFSSDSCQTKVQQLSAGQTHYIFYYILLFRFFIILLVITILPFVYVDYFSYLYKIY